MINRNKKFAWLLCGSFIFIPNIYAQDKDVDQADSLDFQSFHKDKKEAIKVWDNKSDTTTKAYSDTPPAPATTSVPAAEASSSTAASAATTNTVAPAAVAATAAAPASDIKGKRFEIRERYTLTRSTKTPYSAFYVIEPLYKQAAQLCARGWKKLTERSEPVEQDYYLYYEIECL